MDALQNELVQTVQGVRDMFDRLRAAEVIAFDTETTIARPLARRLVGLSFADAATAWYVPVGHKAESDKLDGSVNVPVEEVVEELRKFVASFEGMVVIHNAVFDLMMLEQYQLRRQEWKPQIMDSMLAVGVLGSFWDKGLKKQVLERYGYEMVELKTILRQHKAKDPAWLPIKGLFEYACDDARWTRRLGIDTLKEIEELKFGKVFWDLEMETMPSVLEMLKEGILLDQVVLQKMDGELELKILEFENEWCKLFPAVSMTSTVQLSQVFFEGDEKHWDPELSAKGKSGHFSTAEGVIAQQVKRGLTKEGRLAATLVIGHRRMSKMRQYTSSLMLLPDTDGRLRPSQNQIGAITGRFSSSDPNCQNIPGGDVEGWPERKGSLPPIRSAFVAAPGWTLVDVDYSQIELRIMAHLSKDPMMLQVYRQKCPCVGGGEWMPGPYKMVLGDAGCPVCKGLGFSGDIHQTTAEATGSTRQEAKATNFGLIYGMGPHSLGGQIGSDPKKAEAYHRRYFETYKGVKQFHAAAADKAGRLGYVKTLVGRVRYIPDVQSTDWSLKSGALRQVWNTACQGSAADLIKIALRNLRRRWEEMGVLGTGCKMLLMVHDELLLEIRNDLVDEQVLVVKEVMESVAQLAVPLVAQPKKARSWMEAH